MTRQFRYDNLGVTHEGLVRVYNEDAMRLRPEIGLWMVADGMGGHIHGRWAAAAIAEEIDALALSDAFAGSLESVAAAIRAANRTILEAADAAGQPIGSTVVALLIQQGRFAGLWTGDSRIYQRRGRDLNRLTRDHSLVQELVDKGQLSADEATDHPMSHILSHAVGTEDPLRLDIVTGEIESGDTFLLCSDGLTDLVLDTEIAEQLSVRDSGQASRSLLDLALSRGAPDNVTVVSVACQAVAARPYPGDA